MNFFFDRYRKLGERPKKVNLHKTIRVNTKKTSRSRLIKKLEKRGVKAAPIPYLKDALEVEAKFSVGATIEYLAGLYYIQEAAAQVPVEILLERVRPKDRILDMCAAPGGKTTQIAQSVDQNIIALDIKNPRLQALKNNIERLGLPNVTVLNFDGNKASKLGKFDKILLDAPCSGNFVTDKEWFNKRSMSGIRTVAKMQAVLLEAAYKALDTGGTLVYSTCSLEPEENEINIDNFLKNHSDCFLIPIKAKHATPGLTGVFGKSLHPSLKRTIRFWPWRTHTEGFFIAKIKKR